MTLTERIVLCFCAHPDWTSLQMATHVGTRHGSVVRNVLRAKGYKLARRPGQTDRSMQPKPVIIVSTRTAKPKPKPRRLIKAAGC